jgi:two-component system, OmpR family, phosphate regulon sensor histidine kinase PhoR
MLAATRYRRAELRIEVDDKKSLAIRGVLAGGVAALIASGLYFTGVFESLEYQLYDRDFRMGPLREAPAETVIVAIDEPSLRRLGSWPWPRAFHAEALRQIKANGAKAIGVDIGFYEPDRLDPVNDEELAGSTREAGNVVYPVVLEEFQQDGQPLVKVMETLPALADAAAGIGHAHIESGADGIARKVHLAYKTPKKTYWGLGLEVLKVYLGLPDGAIREIQPGVLGIGDIEIPVTSDPQSREPGEGRIAIDYEMHIAYAGDRDTFEYIPAHEVIEGSVPPNHFAGKIVLYGGKAAGLYDHHMTPFSAERAPMTGVEIQANVIDAILKQRSIRRTPLWMLSGLTALAAIGAAVLYQFVDTRLAALLMVVLIGTTMGTHIALFRAGHWMEVSPIVVSLVLALIFGLMLKMRQVNVALDQEVLNLTQAAALANKAGERAILETFNAAEPTLRDLLGVPAAALLEVDRKKGILTLTAQYGLARMNPREKTKLKLTGDLTGLLVGLGAMEVSDLTKHPLAVLVPRAQLSSYHALVVPLLAKGETVGALCLFRPVAERFAEEEQTLFQAVSGEFGSIWYNSSLYGRLTKKSSNPVAPFTYKSQERRIQTLNVLSDAVLGEKSLMASIMDSIADGVIVTDVLGTIRILNPKAKEILGLYGESAVGQSAVDFVRRFEDVPHEVMRERFEKIVERGETFSAEIRISIPATRFYKLQLGPVRSRDGMVHGIVGVLSDITELKEMDQMKTDLMSMVTHEIRTPLATVRGFAQILLKGGIAVDKSKEFLEIINRQSNRLVNLVNDFLDITRIESGRQVITKAPVDMDKLIQNAVADLKPLADEKNISIQYVSPGKLPEVFGDRNLIEQVLINLLSNAIKYSPKGAWARVAMAQLNGSVAITVQDNGLGIPKESIPRLFEKFYRVRCDDRKDIIGTGLGLSLVKQIIDLHQGTIRVESEHGEGSTFIFTIPVTKGGREPITITTAAAVLSPMAGNRN